MKKILFFLIVSLLFVSCGDDEYEHNTSVKLYSEGDYNIYDARLGFFDNKGNCKLIVKLGDITKDKPSEKLFLDRGYENVYLFSDRVFTLKYDTIYTIVSGIDNIIILNESTKANTVNKNNPKEYPVN